MKNYNKKSEQLDKQQQQNSVKMLRSTYNGMHPSIRRRNPSVVGSLYQVYADGVWKNVIWEKPETKTILEKIQEKEMITASVATSTPLPVKPAEPSPQVPPKPDPDWKPPAKPEKQPKIVPWETPKPIRPDHKD